MRRAGNLLGKIADPDNLRLAFWKAQRGKAGRGEIRAFRADLGANLVVLRKRIISGNLGPVAYRRFMVRDPKERLISAAPFPERVLQHAIMNICEPVLERGAIFDSYACRTGKGVRRAVRRAQVFTRASPWYLKMDVRKYFDSIDHAVALELLARRIKDPGVLQLFRGILDGYHCAPGKGVPIGSLVSQHLANLYLSALDHHFKEERRMRGYARYMDDLLIFGEDREAMKVLLTQARTFLRARLFLELKEPVQINRTDRGVPFLGYRVFPGRILLAPRTRRRFAWKLRAIEERLAAGIWDEATAARHAEPLAEFTRTAAAAGFRRGIIARVGAAFAEVRTA